jgi:hypothetical protein
VAFDLFGMFVTSELGTSEQADAVRSMKVSVDPVAGASLSMLVAQSPALSFPASERRRG